MFNIFRKSSAPALRKEQPIAPSPSTPEHRAALGLTPAYPPKNFSSYGSADNTVQAVPVQVMLDVAREQIAELRNELGYHEEDFQRIALPMVRRYFEWVHLLPASANHHHARLGGLALHGLDVATRAARATHNSVLDFDPSYTTDLALRAKRRRLWPLAVASAGLTHDLGKVLIDQIITCADTGALWNPFAEPLLGWAERNRVKRYAIRWRGGDRFHRHEPFGLLLFGNIIGTEIMGLLASLGRDVMEAVLSCFATDVPDKSGIRAMVLNADVESVKQDRDEAQAIWNESGFAVDPVLHRLLEAGNRLLQKRDWRPNAEGHHILVSDEGAWLLWPQAFNSMRMLLGQEGQLAGIPADANEVASMFVRAKIAKPRVLSNGHRWDLWSLELAGAEQSGEGGYDEMIERFTKTRSALLIPDPSVLFSGVPLPARTSIRVARDPTLPVAAAATIETPAAANPPSAAKDDHPTTDLTASSSATETPAHSMGSVSDEDDEMPDRPAPAVPVSAAPPAAHVGGTDPGPAAAPTDAASAAVPDGAGNRTADALALLEGAGPFGEVLLRVLRRFLVDSSRKPGEVIHRKGPNVLLKWPDILKPLGVDVRIYAEELRAHPDILPEQFLGKPIDISNNGITVSTRVKNSVWNAVVLNESLSDAVDYLARNPDALRGIGGSEA